MSLIREAIKSLSDDKMDQALKGLKVVTFNYDLSVVNDFAKLVDVYSTKDKKFFHIEKTDDEKLLALIKKHTKSIVEMNIKGQVADNLATRSIGALDYKKLKKGQKYILVSVDEYGEEDTRYDVTFEKLKGKNVHFVEDGYPLVVPKFAFEQSWSYIYE